MSEQVIIAFREKCIYTWFPKFSTQQYVVLHTVCPSYRSSNKRPYAVLKQRLFSLFQRQVEPVVVQAGATQGEAVTSRRTRNPRGDLSKWTLIILR